MVQHRLLPHYQEEKEDRCTEEGSCSNFGLCWILGTKLGSERFPTLGSTNSPGAGGRHQQPGLGGRVAPPDPHPPVQAARGSRRPPRALGAQGVSEPHWDTSALSRLVSACHLVESSLGASPHTAPLHFVLPTALGMSKMSPTSTHEIQHHPVTSAGAAEARVAPHRCGAEEELGSTEPGHGWEPWRTGIESFAPIINAGSPPAPAACKQQPCKTSTRPSTAQGRL